MKISVVVPAFNEEKMIQGCLRSIGESVPIFDQRGWSTEVIVCDNNSSDATAQLAREMGAKVVFEPVNQISRARNTGAAAASGNWIIFVDADSFPSPALFNDVAGQITSGKCIAGGVTIRLDEAGLLSSATARLWACVSRCLNWCAGSFIFCEAEAFRSIGGFSLELYASEEIDLSRRLKKLGKETGRKVVILHRHPLVTSARKVRLYSTLEHLRFVTTAVLFPKRTVKSRDACWLWYGGRR